MNEQLITRDDWLSFVEEQTKSNLTQKEFCKQKDLSLVRFNYNVQRYRKQTIKGQKQKQPQFSEIVIQSKQPSPSANKKIEFIEWFSL